MSEFIKDLSTLHFWLAVVVVGLLLEIAGHLLSKPIDRFLSRTFSWWKFRSEAKAAKRQKLIVKLREDTKEQIKHLIVMAVFFQLAVLAAILATIVFSVASIHDMLKGNVAPPDSTASTFLVTFKLAGAFFIFASYINFGLVYKDAKILREAYRDFNSAEKDKLNKPSRKGQSSSSKLPTVQK